MIEFKTVDENDFENIIALNKKHIKPEELLWKVTKNDLEHYLNKTHSYVAKEGENIAGYLLNFESDAQTSQKKELVPEFENLIQKEIITKIRICIGQLCVDNSFQRKNIALNLYKKLFSENTDYDLRIAEILKSCNPSYNLHHKKLKIPCVGIINNDPDRMIFAKIMKPNKILQDEILKMQNRFKSISIR